MPFLYFIIYLEGEGGLFLLICVSGLESSKPACLPSSASDTESEGGLVSTAVHANNKAYYIWNEMREYNVLIPVVYGSHKSCAQQ